MNKNYYQVTLTFTTEVLGSQPQRDVVTEFIHPPEVADDESEALPDALEKATTAFHKVDDEPVFFDYQIKGFLKEAAKVINGLKIKETKNLRSKVEDHVFVEPRIIKLVMPAGSKIVFCERPLRAETAQGPRVALVRSEQAPEGSQLVFRIGVLEKSPITASLLEDLLSYGQDKGLGQWRNGGHGRFLYTIEPL